MTTLVASTASMTTALVSHLCESTVFAAIAWLLTLALRKYPARVRFSVWMFASLKFLIPFALLTSLGAHWTRPNPQHQVHVAFYTVIEEFSQPFAHGHSLAAGPVVRKHSADISTPGFEVLAAVWLCGCLLMIIRWTLQWMRARRVIDQSAPADEGREIRALRRVETETRSRKSIPIAVTPRALEPGIFGVIRPVLLWPERLSEKLDDLQIEAIVAHELEHIRRRDNLISTLHALVEALFWFNPAVHWMGARMSEERERACDERVIEQSAQPEKYARSILTVCAFCIESPLPCVAGVSGSDLKKRILRIMNHQSGAALTISRRVLLAGAAALAFLLPIGFGLLRGQAGPVSKSGEPNSEEHRDLPRYDVSSVKPASSSDGRGMIRLTPDGASLQGIPVQMLLHLAFNVEDDRIIGAPSWVKSNRYDVEAKVAPEDAPRLDKLKLEDRRAMLLPLLADRFNLKYHHETRELPMYALVIAKDGPKLTASTAEAPPDPNFPATREGQPKGGIDTRGRMMMEPDRIESQDTTIDMLAHALAPRLGRSVVDKTGLTGRYDYTLRWTPDDAPPPGPGGDASAHGDAANDAAEVSLITAIQEQLGLKLESQKGAVDVIVIDHIDLPAAN
jgi:bla regulator protein BlaR1